MNNWRIIDDTVGVSTGRKELAVSNGTIGIIIEYTTYTGRFSAKGMRLARRVCDVLNLADTHSAFVEATQDDGGSVRRQRRSYAGALARAREVGFTGREAQAVARRLSRAKR